MRSPSVPPPRSGRGLIRTGLALATSALLVGVGASAAFAAPTPGSGTDIGSAIEAVPGLVTGATLTGPLVAGDNVSAGVSVDALGQFPVAGSSYGVLSTGLLSEVAYSGALASTDLGGGAVRGDTDRDVTVLSLDVNVPVGANCLAFDFKFLSEEYPGWVGSIYNDGFVAELDTSTWTTSGSTITAPDNFAFDDTGGIVSVNSTGIGGMSAAEGTGTAFDSLAPWPDGGATTLLTAGTRVMPGTHQLYLSIFDQGNPEWDSAVFVDNLRAIHAPDYGRCADDGAAVLIISLDLQPETATHTVGETHTATAALTDNFGAPYTAGSVIFTVAGAHTVTSAPVPVEADGTAAYAYTGTVAGDDTVTACYVAAGATDCSAAPRVDTATVTWEAAPSPPPVPAQCGDVGPEIPGALDHAVVGHTGNQSNFFRFASKNRVLTALFSAQNTHGWCDVAILASSADYSDALAAAPLAEILGAPVLLANADGTLDPQVTSYLANNFNYVIIASGPGVIPDKTKDELNDALVNVVGNIYAGVNTVRVAGVNRYETAGTLAIASLLFSEEDWTSGTNFILADGRNFPDALAAGPAAAKVDNGVVLLTAGADGVPSFTAQFLVGNSVSFSPATIAWLPTSFPGGFSIDWNNIGAFNHQSITVVGGAARIAADKGALGLITEPIEYDDALVGADRYETATLVAGKYFGSGVTYYTIASGQQFPDAVVAGGWAANVGGPLVLTRDNALPKVTKDYLVKAADNGDKFVVFGGTGSVSPAVSEDLAKTFVW